MKFQWRDVWHGLCSAFSAARRTIASRTVTPLHVIAWRPLNAGGVLYVADVDGRRLVFVAGQRTACLLAQYDAPPQPEGTSEAKRLKAQSECSKAALHEP